MRSGRGYTLLEIGVAFGMLAIALSVASVLVVGHERHQQVLWEDAIAGELALSVLEQALAEPRLEPTPLEGRRIEVAPAPDGGPVLPDLKTALVVRDTPGQAGMVELRAIVTWRSAAVMAAGDSRTVERTVRRRSVR
jgi:type II secretory pathway pseudopilin PulG